MSVLSQIVGREARTERYGRKPDIVSDSDAVVVLPQQDFRTVLKLGNSLDA